LQQKRNRDQQLIVLQQRVLNDKQAQRKHLAQLSFEEKYHLLIAMQKRSKAILALRGKNQRVWPEDNSQ
jgi:hypothetical protein